MKYYDIHTHYIPKSRTDNTIYILNLFPESFWQSEEYGVNVFFSSGVHPWHSEESDNALHLLQKIAQNKRVIAIGEAGFDKFKGADAPIQEKVFRRQIELSELVEKPMVVHSVKSWDRLIETYNVTKPQQPWILHGYRGKPELAKRLVDLGFYFSVGQYFNPEALKLIPNEKLFCETDESEMEIEEVYSRVADALQIELKAFAAIVEDNVKRIFPSMCQNSGEDCVS